MITAAAAVLCVADLPASLAWYAERLAFPARFAWGEPPTYAILCRDDVEFHLVAQPIARRPPGQSALCLFVTDIDALYADLLARGAPIPRPPQTHDYGMREFEVTDPDGNRLIFGMGVTQPGG